MKTPSRITLLVALAALSGAATPALAAPPVQRFNFPDEYYIYYRDWDQARINAVEDQAFELVICDPRGITPAQVDDLQDGKDDSLNTADDIKVIGYISVGEDNRPSAVADPCNFAAGFKAVSGGQGPRKDPRPVDGSGNPTTSIASTVTAGVPSLGNATTVGSLGFERFYVDDVLSVDTNSDGTPDARDGKPDGNPEFGGAYVNMGDPTWFTTINTMTIAGTTVTCTATSITVEGVAGLQQIMGTGTGEFGMDGIFMDAMEPPSQPNFFSPSAKSEWTAPGGQKLVETIRNTYPSKLILQNRGLYYFHPQFEAYNFSTRPFIDLLLFESYYADSNDYDTISPFFNDNRYNYAPKVAAEADREDGFSIVTLEYFEPRSVYKTITVDGTTTDWPLESEVQKNTFPSTSNALQNAWIANDANYIYLRVQTKAGGLDLANFRFRAYFDLDDANDDLSQVSTSGYGWPVTTSGNVRSRSELLLEGATLYSQDEGSFNRGQLAVTTYASNTAQTEWEFRIPRNLVHPAGHAHFANQNVFGANGTHFNVFLTYENTSNVLEYIPAGDGSFDANFGYRLEQPTGTVLNDSFVESQQKLGFITYLSDKFLSFPVNGLSQAWNTANGDTAAPVWNTTANGFVARGASAPNAARVGVQQVVPGNGQAIVRWDTANDQSTPVRYKIYYAKVSDNPGTTVTGSSWSNTGIISGTAPSNYSFGGWAANNTNVYANEYTVTGLSTNTAYRFIVRAVDSASTIHEETNTTYIDSTTTGAVAANWATISVDGNTSDWPSTAKVWTDPSGDKGTGASDVAAVWIANDATTLYFRIDAHNAHDFPNQFNNIYFDADLNTSDTSFNPYSAGLIYSELLLQGASLYSQKNGNFNDGYISATSAYVPIGTTTATSWEFSIPRNLQHPSGVGGGSVFSTTGFKMLVTSGSSTSDEIAGAFSYNFAIGSVYKTITANGTIATNEWPVESLVYTDPSGDNLGAATDIARVYLTNDNANLYLRVDTHNSHNMPGAFNNFYFDTNLNVAPGFNPHGLNKISSKLLLNGVSLFSEGNGGFNDGYISGTTYGPTAGTSATSWEFAIPLSIVHPTGSGARAGQTVFPALGTEIALLLTSDNSGAAEFAPDAGNLRYRLADLNITPSSTLATITVDGTGSDWPSGAQVWTDASGDNNGATSDISAVWLANDVNYIYLRIDTHNSHNYVGAFNNTYFDANLSAASGFTPHSLLFGSEMLLQNGGIYSQKNGGFNEGNVTSTSSKTVSYAPTSGNATTWEWRIPRDLVHPSSGGNVFTETDNSFFLFVTSDNSGLAERAPNNPAAEFIWYVPAN